MNTNMNFNMKINMNVTMYNYIKMSMSIRMVINIVSLIIMIQDKKTINFRIITQYNSSKFGL